MGITDTISVFQVTKHFNRERRILSAVEQHEIPGLMKLFSKRSMIAAPRGVAKRCKSRRKDHWWACGRCFFERGKKSTIKNHLIQQVCQKSVEIRKRGKNCDILHCSSTFIRK